MHLATESGEIIAPGAILHAVMGPYKGRAFRFLDIHDDRERIIVAFHGAHPFRHQRVTLHPSAFSLFLREEITRLRAALNRCHHLWQRVDEGLIMGALALIPLALFEAYHGGEVTRHVLESIFNTHMNTGGGDH